MAVWKKVITSGSAASVKSLTVSTDLTVGDDLTLNTDSAVFNMGDGNDVTLTHDGTTGVTIAANPITIDSGADIILDADGADIIFKDGGTAIGKISNSSSDLVIENEVDAKDIIFKQYDGTTTLTLSDDTSATFAADVTITGDLTANGNIAGDGSTAISSMASLGIGSVTATGTVQAEQLTSTDDLSLTSDSAVFGMGVGGDVTLTHDGTTGGTLAGTPISINSTGDLTLDSTTDVVIDADGGNVLFKDNGTTKFDFGLATNPLTMTVAGNFAIDSTGDIKLDAAGGDIFFQDDGTTFGSATNTSGNLIIKSGTTTAATFSGANVTLAGTVGCGAITSTGKFTVSADAVAQNFSASNDQTSSLAGAYITNITGSMISMSGDVSASKFYGSFYGDVANATGGSSPNDSTITLAAGDGLKTGGSFTTNASGGSTITFDIDVSDFAGNGLEADGSENLRVDISGLSSTLTAVDQADYVAVSDEDAGDDETKKITFSNFEDEIFGNVSGDILIAAGGEATIQADSVALGTDTTGNYVGTLSVGAGMAAVNADGEGSSKAIAVDGVLEDLDTMGAAASDGQFIVATGAGASSWESGATLRTSIGVGTGNSPQFTDLTLTGDLTVNGDLTYLNTTNLLVEDTFIYVASSSLNDLDVDGGMIVGSGSAGTGSAFYWDGGDDRWGVALNVAQHETSLTALQYVMTVSASDGTPGAGDGAFGVGEMWINTDLDDGAGNGTIFIRTE
tara:strand:+ start:644 stop:2854 length:2211 start_codon:yes stop_codon:yes gene_type:complete